MGLRGLAPLIDSAASGESVLVSPLEYGNLRAPEFGGNPLIGHSLADPGCQPFAITQKRHEWVLVGAVLGSVSGVGRNQLQVLRSVVGPVTVDVVDDLAPLQHPPQRLLHDQPVFRDMTAMGMGMIGASDEDVPPNKISSRADLTTHPVSLWPTRYPVSPHVLQDRVAVATDLDSDFGGGCTLVNVPTPQPISIQESLVFGKCHDGIIPHGKVG